MHVFADQPETDPDKADQLWRFTLSLPGVVAAISPGNLELFQNLALPLARKGDPALTDNIFEMGSEQVGYYDYVHTFEVGTKPVPHQRSCIIMQGMALREHYAKMNVTPIFHEFDKSGSFVGIETDTSKGVASSI